MTHPYEKQSVRIYLYLYLYIYIYIEREREGEISPALQYMFYAKRCGVALPSKKIHRQSAFFKMPTRVPLLIFLRFSHKNNVKECYNCAKVQNSLSCSLKNKIFGSAKRRNLQHIFTQTKNGGVQSGEMSIYIYM